MKNPRLDDARNIATEVATVVTISLVTVAAFMNDSKQAPYALGLLVVYCTAIGFREALRNRRRHLERELFLNKERLEAEGTIQIDDLLIRSTTELTSFRTTVGMIVTSIIIDSPYRIADESSNAEGVGYSLLTLLAGWWAMPLGPLLTVAVVKQNLSGGYKRSVASMIKEKQQAIPAEAPLPYFYRKKNQASAPSKKT